MKARATESERLIDWAFREFSDVTLFKPGDVVDDAQVWLGAEAKVPLTVSAPVLVTLPRNARRALKVTEQYDGPVKAPVAKAQPIGKLVITVPGMNPAEFPLVAAAPVDRLGSFGRMGAALSYLVFRGH
jgi:D-alanyl-D-alanine carboxypeptidase (penicillin-binding protein 5/6)